MAAFAVLPANGSAAAGTAPFTKLQYKVSSVAFSPNGHTLAAAGVTTDYHGHPAGAIRVWDATNPSHPIPLAVVGFARVIDSVAFSPDGHMLAAGGSTGPENGIKITGAIRMWDATDPSHPTPLGQPLTGPAHSVTSIAFSPDGHTLAATDGCEGKYWLWNVTDPTKPVGLSQPVIANADVSSVAFSPDGRTLATTSVDNISNVSEVQLWHIADPAHPTPLGQPLTGPAYGLGPVAFSPGGHTLAAAGSHSLGSFDSVWLWEVTNPADPTPLGQSLIAPANGFDSATFSPDRHTLATIKNGAVRLLTFSDSATISLGPPLTALGNATAPVFNPGGHIVATEDNTSDGVLLWNITDPMTPSLLGHPLELINPVIQ